MTKNQKKEIVVAQKNVISIHGTETITSEGLLDIAHQCGLKKIDSEILMYPCTDNGNTVITKSTVTLENGISCSAIGDASPTNVPAGCADSFIRVANTRATNRAIELACNVGNLSLGRNDKQAIDVEYFENPAPALPPSHDGITERQYSCLSVDPDIDMKTQELYGKNLEELSKQEACELIQKRMNERK